MNRIVMIPPKLFEYLDYQVNQSFISMGQRDYVLQKLEIIIAEVGSMYCKD